MTEARRKLRGVCACVCTRVGWRGVGGEGVEGSYAILSRAVKENLSEKGIFEWRCEGSKGEPSWEYLIHSPMVHPK